MTRLPPNARRVAMQPAEALRHYDADLALAVSRFGDSGYFCIPIAEARAWSRAFHHAIDTYSESPKET